MRHGMANKKLNRTAEHRKALLKNMLNSLIKYEQIKTTLPKAKFLKPQADKLITLGKKNSLHNTKMLVSQLQDITSANKVKGIRASNVTNVKTAIQSVEHNDVNVLCLGSENLDIAAAKEITESFLNSSFLNEERYINRINKLS